MKQLFLPFNEPNLCNIYILKDPEYIDRSCINFSCYCDLNQIDSDIDPLDNVLLTKDVLRSTEKSKSLGPHKSKLEKTKSKKKSCLKTRNSGM